MTLWTGFQTTALSIWWYKIGPCAEKEEEALCCAIRNKSSYVLFNELA